MSSSGLFSRRCVYERKKGGKESTLAGWMDEEREEVMIYEVKEGQDRK